MADQRSAFRFRLPWLPAASAARQTTPQPATSRTPATAPRRAAETQGPPQPTSTTTSTPSQSTGGATPAPRRASEARVASQPTSTTTPTPGQSTGSATPTPTPERPTETQVPSPPTSTITPTPGQSTGSATPAPATAPQRTTETQVPSQPTSTTTRTGPQSVDTGTSVQPTTKTSTTTMTPQTQSTTTTIPSSATPQKVETEAPSPPIATKTPVLVNTQTTQTQPPAATASATVATTERPPFRSPGATAPKAPLPQPQASRTKSQPSSPSRLTSQSRVSSQPESPSRTTTQPRSSQPSTPSRATSQSQATSLLSSPSRTGSPKSPASRTSSQPRSQPRVASGPAGQTSSTSPSSKAAQGQPITATLAESTFSSKSEPKLNSKSTVSEQESIEELQPKEEAKSGMIYDSKKQTPVETSTKPNEMELQPLNEPGRRTTTISTPNGGPQTSVPTKKSDTPTSSEPESFQQDPKPEETKEVKEIMQEIKEKTYKGSIEKDEANPASPVQTKEQLSFIYQSKQAQQAVDQKEVTPKPASNGKETKMTAHPRNETVSVESRQKQAMTNGEHIPLHKEIRGDISKLVQKMAAGDTKQSIDDRPVTVVTLAGENRGAIMQLGTDLMKKGGAVHIRRGYKVNPDESIETTITGEGSSKVKSKDTEDMKDQAPDAFVNSNVQGINNSIMSNGSITEQNPGVHLVHSRFPIKFKESTAETEFLGREKTEFSTTHAQRLTYEPMVRRRCLRGLFLESSDSDPENTTKPRHHGCRVGCKEKSEENKIDVFWQASP